MERENIHDKAQQLSVIMGRPVAVFEDQTCNVVGLAQYRLRIARGDTVVRVYCPTRPRKTGL